MHDGEHFNSTIFIEELNVIGQNTPFWQSRMHQNPNFKDELVPLIMVVVEGSVAADSIMQNISPLLISSRLNVFENKEFTLVCVSEREIHL